MKIIIEKKSTINTQFKFQASKEDWDLGDKLGFGQTIQEAIDDLIECYEDTDRPITDYTWRGLRSNEI